MLELAGIDFAGQHVRHQIVDAVDAADLGPVPSAFARTLMRTFSQGRRR